MIKLTNILQESDLGLTYKKGKTIKVTHKKSGKELIIIDKPNVRKEYEKIGFFVEGSCGYGIDGEVGDEPAGPHLIKKKKKKVDEGILNEYKKIAFSGKGNFTDVVKSLKESINEATKEKNILIQVRDLKKYI